MMKRVVVLGLGNLLLGDEGVGVRVVNALMEHYHLPPGVEGVDGGTAGMGLLDVLAGCDCVLLCDAVQTDAPPGSVIRLTGADLAVLLQTRYSPHQLGLSDVLATLTLLGETPREVTVIGIVPARLELGTNLSPPVANAVSIAVAQVVSELSSLGFSLRKR